ncbi:MAG: hypothetical protein LBF66_03330 [Holosporales bacterium]|jgi:hypothetical protein|nr:hypothetical protein [Holosporales bacterium]
MLKKYLFLALLTCIGPIAKCSGSVTDFTGGATTALKVQELFTRGIVLRDLMSKEFSSQKIIGQLDEIIQSNVDAFELARIVFVPENVHAMYRVLAEFRRKACPCALFPFCCCVDVDEDDMKLVELRTVEDEIFNKGTKFFQYVTNACANRRYADQFQAWSLATMNHLQRVRRDVSRINVRQKTKLELLSELLAITAINPDTDVAKANAALRNAFYESPAVTS